MCIWFLGVEGVASLRLSFHLVLHLITFPIFQRMIFLLCLDVCDEWTYCMHAHVYVRGLFTQDSF